MDLKSGYPFWAIRNGLMRAYPRLQQDLECEVLVIGGGITGALVADRLVQAGREVVVVEQRDVAWGSTSASTALLQYEIDTPLVDLIALRGRRHAVAAYRACSRAVEELAVLARGLRGIDFQHRDSLYFASRPRDVEALRDEHAARNAHGLSCEWVTRRELDTLGIDSHAALLSRVAATVDPYRFAHALLARVQARGAVFDRTRVTAMEATRRRVAVALDTGHRVVAGHVVMATGYAAQQWLPQRVADNRSSYAFVTDPLPDDVIARYARLMLWETARPYLYLRATRDRRMVVGGEDDAVDAPARRDARVQGKARRLAKAVRKRFNGLDLAPAFAWGGTFAETKDGLPFVGSHREWGPRVHFAMAYGGNGITYSHLAADMIRDAIAGTRHPLAPVFAFGRA